MTFNARGGLWLLVAVCAAINFAASIPDIMINNLNEVSCLTPISQPGNCLVLTQCDYVSDIVKANGIASPEVLDFVRKSTCGYDAKEPKVCCPIVKDPEDPNVFDLNGNKTKDSIKQKGDNLNDPFQNPLSLLPIKCGKDLGNRIIGGEMAEFDEFPWMAVIEYQYSRGKIIGCGGALITKRYVLTAAHCIRAIPSTWRLSNVRLGEYNTHTDPDCFDEGNGYQKCADPVLSIPIEREIVHENYMKPRTYHNDIALLRLSRDVETTRFVQPICLPNNDAVSQLYWSAGWGQIERKSSSEVKVKVSLPYADFNECARVYATKNILLADGQMCVGGRAGKDTCKGDSGGPLMKQIREPGKLNRWIVDGVVSIGHSPCGLPGWPAVYTKIYDYVPWIISKLKP